jgi:uncharacterized protein (DUF927 family)
LEAQRGLVDGGLDVGVGKKPKDLLMSALLRVQVMARTRAVSVTGWYNSVYVLPDCSIGDRESERTIIQTDKYLDHNYKVKGTLEEWQSNVAAYAEGNSRLVLAISTAFARFCRRGSFSEHLVAAAKSYYGTAVRAFIEALAADLESVEGEAKAGVRDFVDKNCPNNADGQVMRVAGRFGYIAYAGELASNLGIVPWQPGEANKSARTCFETWIAARGGIEAAEITGGMAQVRAFLSAHGSSRFEDAWNPPRDCDGKILPSRESQIRLVFARAPIMDGSSS